MKLWRISQTVNQGWDTYDSAIVAAETEEAAQSTHPCDPTNWGEEFPTWAHSPEQVRVELIGVAAAGVPAGVVLASFNAG